MAHRDRISQLPEELLLRILSLLPAKDLVVTMLLSKQWKFLWMLVPRLDYDHNMYQDCEGSRFSRFVYGSLLLHEAPVLECLRLKLYGESFTPVDIGVCVRTAVKRNVRELDIDISCPLVLTPFILPWSLCAGGCRVLVTLKLSNMTLVDASSLPASSFPSLKVLSLVEMKYPNEEFINKLLANLSVPVCVLSSLETMEWVKYEGTEEEKEAVAYIFRNARCLKKATISSSSRDPVKKLKQLSLPRFSSTCHLTFY